MSNEILAITREAGVELLIQKAPLPPHKRSHSYDDEYDVEWRIGEQRIHLSLETKDTQARWLSWRKCEYPIIKNDFQYLDITKPQTWHHLFETLQSHLQPPNNEA